MSGGRLIALEGGPGSPTGRQAQLLAEWLDAGGVPAEVAEWGSSWLWPAGIGAVEQRGYPGRITPFLARLADMAEVWQRRIEPQLRAGAVVIADRYRLTLLAHGLVRRLEASWVEGVVSVLPAAAVSVYLHCRPTAQLGRLMARSQPLEGWEAGVDWTRATSLAGAFRAYQARVDREFDAICRRGDLVALDADADETRLHVALREHVQRALEVGQ